MTGLTRMTGMARFRRPVVTALIVCAALAVLPACGKRNTDQETLRKIVEHTRRLGAKFEYHDDRPDSKVEVQGLVEDDFRFKTRVFYDGQPAFDEVVSDDVLAMRVLDPSRLGLLVDRKQADPKTESELQGVSVIDVLRSRRWVQDPTGAPVVSGLGQTEATLGVDPAIDAVTSLDYTLAAINQSAGVRKWDKDSLSPTYARTEDPFEQPSRESGITRYDLARPDLPSPGASRNGVGGQSAVPTTKHFRKMAVYVKDGTVMRVEERVEITGKGLKDFANWFQDFIRDSKVGTAARDTVQKIVKTVPEAQQGPVLLRLLSTGLVSFGEQPILQRSMTLRLEEVGSKVDISLPNEQLVRGNLSALVTSATAKKPQAVSGGDTGSTGSTGAEGSTGSTTTTAAP